MYAKIVVSVVLVSILPCESQQQRFFAVPFENNDGSTSKPHQSQQLIHNNHFVTEKSHHNGNLHANLRRNNNFFANSIVSNTEPQLNINQEHFNNNFGRIFNGQQTHTSTIDQQQLQRFPTGDDFTINQPIQMFGMDPTSDLTQQIQQNNEKHRELLNSLIKSKEPPAKPINTFLSVEEPVLTVIEEPKSTPDQIPINSQIPFTESQQRFSQQARSQFPQQLHTSFIPLIHQQQVSHQIEQPQIHDHRSHQIQQVHHQIDPHPPIFQQPLLHISQQIQPQFPSQTPQPTHRPRIQRPISRNNRQGVNLNPQSAPQPEFIINVQPNAIPTPVHRFSSPRRPGSSLHISTKTNRDFEEEIFRQQAESAKYSFASQIDDSINGNQHQREEVRDGVNVKGMYSYQDGYVKRTVFYEADDKGYRVVKEEEEPLGDGPQFNPNGRANVSSFVAGNALQYSITSDDIQKKNRR